MEKNFGKGEAILEIHVANILSNLAKKKLSDKFLSFYDVAHKQRSLCCVHRLHNIMYIAQVNLALYSLIRKFTSGEFAHARHSSSKLGSVLANPQIWL